MKPCSTKYLILYSMDVLSALFTHKKFFSLKSNVYHGIFALRHCIYAHKLCALYDGVLCTQIIS